MIYRPPQTKFMGKKIMENFSDKDFVSYSHNVTPATTKKQTNGYQRFFTGKFEENAGIVHWSKKKNTEFLCFS